MHFSGNEKFSVVMFLKVSVVFVLCGHLGCIFAQRNSGSGVSRGSPSNYKDALFVYPTGIRSERDVPVCPSLIEDENKDAASTGFSHSGVYGGNELNKLQQPGSTRNPFDSKKSETPRKYLSACNIIHKRYFYSLKIERLCRCPDRTECPMEWSPPPKYKDLISSIKDAKQGMRQMTTTTASTKIENTMDPFTVMISSRSQLKFCTEVSTHLPVCENKQSKDSNDDAPAMVKTVRKTFLAPELPSITVNCYCPPLYRGWTFMSKNEPMDHANETVETQYSYRCDKLPRCKSGQQCGTVRTDLHFSFYHCSCPKKHLCVPKVYPPVSTEDVFDDVDEALYSGQVSPAFCTPELGSP